MYVILIPLYLMYLALIYFFFSTQVFLIKLFLIHLLVMINHSVFIFLSPVSHIVIYHVVTFRIVIAFCPPLTLWITQWKLYCTYYSVAIKWLRWFDCFAFHFSIVFNSFMCYVATMYIYLFPFVKSLCTLIHHIHLFLFPSLIRAYKASLAVLM